MAWQFGAMAFSLAGLRILPCVIVVLPVGSTVISPSVAEADVAPKTSPSPGRCRRRSTSQGNKREVQCALCRAAIDIADTHRRRGLVPVRPIPRIVVGRIAPGYLILARVAGEGERQIEGR